MCAILVGKLPPDLQLILSRNVTEDQWTLKKLLSTVEKEITARERLAQAEAPHRSENKNPSTATTLVMKKSVLTCCFVIGKIGQQTVQW